MFIQKSIHINGYTVILEYTNGHVVGKVLTCENSLFAGSEETVLDQIIKMIFNL